MGQARLYKRLRKQAGYSWIGVAQRKYAAGAFLVLANCSRVTYRNLKKALRK